MYGYWMIQKVLSGIRMPASSGFSRDFLGEIHPFLCHTNLEVFTQMIPSESRQNHQLTNTSETDRVWVKPTLDRLSLKDALSGMGSSVDGSTCAPISMAS